MAHAQDVIVLKNANEIEAKVSAISPDAVTYKRWNNIDGPTYTIPKSEIFYIKYQNGEKEVVLEQSVEEKAVRHMAKSGKQSQNKKPALPLAIRYRGEVNLGYAIANRKPNLFSESFTEYRNDSGELVQGYACSATDTLYSNLSRPLFETIHGVEIGPYLFVGAGLGLQYFNGKLQDWYGWANPRKENNKYKWNTLMLPIFANIKLMYPINDKFTPFLNLSVGGAVTCASALNYDDYQVLERHSLYDYILRDVDASYRVRGGFYCEFGGGLRYKNLNLALGLLYQTMNIKAEYLYQNYTNSGNINSNRLNGKLIQKFSSFYMKVGVNF